MGPDVRDTGKHNFLFYQFYIYIFTFTFTFYIYLSYLFNVIVDAREDV